MHKNWSQSKKMAKILRFSASFALKPKRKSVCNLVLVLYLDIFFLLWVKDQIFVIDGLSKKFRPFTIIWGIIGNYFPFDWLPTPLYNTFGWLDMSPEGPTKMGLTVAFLIKLAATFYIFCWYDIGFIEHNILVKIVIRRLFETINGWMLDRFGI